jgi:Lon protease-like protein
MTNFIPIFPLAIVLYPGEDVNLHIFEPRYKQLIRECYDAKKNFGVPVILNNAVAEMGTMVEIKELSRAYDNGEMDIKTRGVKVFRILEIIKEIPGKLYSGAIVNYPDNNEKGNRELMQKLLAGIKELHRLLNVTKDFKKPEEELTCYDVAHHAGLSLEEEYEFLGLMHELQRQEYLKRHLSRTLPIVAQMENLKEKIQLNGHFKNLSSFNFEI